MRHDIDLISLAADYSVAGYEYVAAVNLKRLENDGQTKWVTMARMMTMCSTIVATGTISVFEALLRHSLDWEEPLTRLDGHLREHGLEDLAERFLDYRAAINVLKHGAGPSHNRLLARKRYLDFDVRELDQPFHDEGDVSEISTLVRADALFVRSCGRLIEQIAQALRQTLPDAPL